MSRVGLIGVGYVGGPLARALGPDVVEVRRETPDDALDACTHFISTVPPGEAGDPVLAQRTSALKRARWLGYVSTTGVYADTGGGWADEDSALGPRVPRQVRRVEAERAWAALDRPLAVFRVAGIYGPGRNVLDQLREGRAKRIDKPDKVFNRIHLDDIARIVLAALEREATGCFNLADGDPRTQREPVEHAANLLGIEPPPLVRFEDAQMSEMMRSFYLGSTRVRSKRLHELGVELQHPDVLAGLSAIYAAEAIS